ncbi:GTP 3',8-cyclase MoaA [Sediminibacter sp. Hel_I_10]|uniref:GTP 3',8-cyclase MoaA n=1 Tax=Sediminibacter sp. Hel_I_10 TaxID=1392490 RepID=UPI0004789312|nr:GTP 3',8-cyclase MoaA [Sediminibacter sp. Hel_I_10]
MSSKHDILTDSFGRKHTYLRISLTERCNLRCSYCMPQEGVPLLPKDHLMNAKEIFEISKLFVEAGVNKIRFTGGEPLLRKDFPQILEQLGTLPVSMSITTNGITIDRYIDLLKKHQVKTINLSLDTLDAEKFKKVTFRDYFQRVYDNIFRLIAEGFHVKINVVLMKGVNDDEIVEFINFTKTHPVTVRFIEFMPFDGNQWNREKTVSYNDVLAKVHQHFDDDAIIRLQDAPHDTTKNFKIVGHLGTFGIIGTVTNPFCDTCNRIRLTANGQLKNCLFSATESDLLTPLRAGKDITPIIQKAVFGKFAMRGGLSTPEQFEDPKEHTENRSMIRIGG